MAPKRHASGSSPFRLPMQRVTALRTLDEVMAELRRLQPQLRQRYPIREMGVFGSWVRGTQKQDSDLDVLVELGDAVGLMELVGLKQDLSDAIGIEVDLVTKDALKQRIGPRILAEVVML
jgi:uncharacterized protein